jgi:hypothetical protein
MVTGPEIAASVSRRAERPAREEFAASPGRPFRQVTAGVSPLHQKSQLARAGTRRV